MLLIGSTSDIAGCRKGGGRGWGTCGQEAKESWCSRGDKLAPDRTDKQRSQGQEDTSEQLKGSIYHGNLISIFFLQTFKAKN